jgi:hypothetical protein
MGFAGFTAIYFDEPLSWTQAGGFSLIALGVRSRVSWPGLKGLRRPTSPDASEDVAHCQDDIGDDCNPEGVGADQWDWDESTDDGEYSQNHRNDKNRGGRRRQIHLQPSLLLTREIFNRFLN